ncbi:Uncharacterised protein [Vibrio cholerae]|nr:Uncharacterised protein [Vibrio cholerae]
MDLLIILISEVFAQFGVLHFRTLADQTRQFFVTHFTT